ncbi:hypothetical protein B0H19DRAFT_1230332, partial [Mycena capillaripes]
MPVEEAILFLPALFPHLDPAHIPKPCALDGLLSSGCPTPSIDLAFHSLNGICALLAASSDFPIPIKLLPVLWPCLWAWLNFLHTYWYYLPMTKHMDEIRHCLKHSSIIVSFDRNDTTRTSKVIRSTPGVRRLLAIAWKAMIYDQELSGQPGSFYVLSDIVRILIDRTDSVANFEEVVDGVGGKIEDLALTVIRHFLCASSNSTFAGTERFLMTCFGFLRPECAGIKILDIALHSIGFIPILIATILALLRTPAVEVTELCVGHLVGSLDSPSKIVLALDSGLLPMIIRVGVQADSSNIDPIRTLIHQLLNKFLPGALVHHAVLSRLKNCLQAAAASPSASAFRASIFADEWEVFCALANERLEFLDSWEKQSRPSLKVCDNMNVRTSECEDFCTLSTLIPDIGSVEKSTCGASSSVVQTVKAFITVPKTVRVQIGPLGTGESAGNYEPPDSTVVLMHKYPGEALFTLFTYSDVGRAKAKVLARSGLDHRDWAAGMQPTFSRAERSGGRVELHLVYGLGLQRILLPMHSATSQLHDGLVRTAQAIPTSWPEAKALAFIERTVNRLIADMEGSM